MDVEFCDWRTVTDVDDHIVETFMVNATALAGEFDQWVIGPNEPSGPDLGKPWLRTTAPAGIYLYQDGEYIQYRPEPEEPAFPPQGVIFWPNSVIPTGWSTYTGAVAAELPTTAFGSWIQKN